MAPIARPRATFAARARARREGGALCARRFPGDGGRAAPRGSGAASGLPQGVAGLRGGSGPQAAPPQGLGVRGSLREGLWAGGG